MEFQSKQMEIEENFVDAAEKAKAFNEALKKLRDVELPEITLTTETEDRNNIIQLGNEINGRSAYLLRGLLIQHGNLLFM